MREIKFRVWDKEKERLLLVDIEGMDSGSMNVKDWDDVIYPFDEDDCILMQYTGLKDKNGKEIYEGDIITIYEGEIMAEVKFKNGAFCYFYDNEHDFTDFGNDAEIIGNIYENPELLEKK